MGHSGVNMRILLSAGLAIAMAAPVGASADTASDIKALHEEMAAMRAAYEQRLQALEQRLKSAEAAATPAAASSATAAVAAPPPAPVAAPVSAGVTGGAATGGASAFNPSMSLILSGLYTRTSRDPVNYSLRGFQLPPDSEAGPGTRGFSLAETELGFAANIDPWLRGAANISVHPDDTISVEEAYVQTTSLGNGLSLKAGRFFSGIGYLNEQHSHVWDFVDAPLAYQAFLGSQFGDDGVQVRWLAPTDLFIEAGAELGRGRSFPGGNNGRNGAGMSALYAHLGGDVGDSSSWRAGLSMLNAKASDQTLVATDAAGVPVTNSFSGSTRVTVADFVWKWAPNGNATRTNFKLQGEYLRSRREGELAYDVAGADALGNYHASQSGWYLQGIYQFMPRWRVGLRTERLDSGNTTFSANPAFGAIDYQPHKNSVMVDFSPSEFSRVRLQLARDYSRLGSPDNQLFLQYQMSLGAHGAHSY
jgi:hypothetical protein